MHSSYGSTSSCNTRKFYIKFGVQTIETTVTENAAVANQWADVMLSRYSGRQTIVGLDTEWKPNTSPDTRNKPATLQLCIDDKCLIVQLFYLDEIPQTLKRFLANPNFTFVGVGVGEDILKLRNEYGFVFASQSDIRDVAKEKWSYRHPLPGLKELAYQICDLDVAKPEQVSRSNWESRVLSDEQVKYACIDAYASYKIGCKLVMQN